ncbi:MAG: NAD(P)-dependent oxidoreductase [Bacteroidales bacterium]|nr:NAD(P)-dependent oxidoreductase [Bacteroidales bacterium]MDD5974747.1 NAD(P)-dependent oxidoreductase [Bacteroidales bacterium]MDY5194454.1 NAD(P)-dependent oxidoreductase [Candidatus Aphodosoma sp.]
MNILITGATGYVGRRVVKQLIENDKNISILTINRDINKAQSILPFSNCKHVSVNDMEKEVLLFNPNVCIHLATLSTSRNDDEIINPMIEANITFGVKLLAALFKADSLQLFINTGSFAEYRNGVENGFNDAYLYTATKSAYRHFVDYYSQLKGFKYINAVPFTIYGGDDTAKKLMDYMMESINAKEPVKMSPGNQILDFVHVDDVVRFYVSAVNSINNISLLPNGSNYYLGTGIGTRVKDLATLIESKIHKRLNIFWGGLNYRPLDVMCAVAPTEDNNQVIPWKTQISLDQGIDKLIKKYDIYEN